MTAGIIHLLVYLLKEIALFCYLYGITYTSVIVYLTWQINAGRGKKFDNDVSYSDNTAGFCSVLCMHMYASW